jgi:hypothetical protein
MHPATTDARIAQRRSAPVYTMQHDSWDAAPRARDATPADNDALLDLAAACETHGALTMRVEREPDFFALNRLEAGWRVGVANGLTPRSVAGCVSVAPRRVYLEGTPTLTAYAGDFKVHPAHRGGAAGDVLTTWASGIAREWGGDDIPGLLTVLAGNAPMERRSEGPRGLPVFTRFATIRSHAIPFVWARPLPTGGPRVSVAREQDIPEMADLWARVAPDRQFAPIHDAGSLATWIDSAPGLGIGSFWVARDQQGRIAGFLGAWDQRSFKQVRVTEFPRRLAMLRAGLNVLTPVTRATPIPDVGDELRWLTAVNVCVPANAPGVLRALVLGVYGAMRTSAYSCLNVGLDVRDPLSVALEGLMAQPTDIHAYITTPAGAYTGPSLRTLPLHHEIALM